MAHDGDARSAPGESVFPTLEVFLTTLRREGVPVGVLEIERLRRVFAAEPHLASERAWYRLLAGLLVKNEAQREIFDRVFTIWQENWPATSSPDGTGQSAETTQEPERLSVRSGRQRPDPPDAFTFDPDADGKDSVGGSVEPSPQPTLPGSQTISMLFPAFRRWWPAALPVIAAGMGLAGAFQAGGATNAWVLWPLGLVTIGVVVWREYQARATIQAPANLTPVQPGPGYLPYLPRSDTSGFLSPEEIREIVWSIGRYVAEDETRALDIEATVARTAAEGNVFTPCYQRAIYSREVWIWEDWLGDSPLPAQLSGELIHHLRRAGLPVRHGSFPGTPHLVHWADGVDFSPLAVEGFRQQAIVLILTDGEDMAEAHRSDWSHHELHRLLHDLAGWQHLAVVDVGEGQHGLEALLAPHGIACLAPWQIPGFMATRERPSRRRPPLFEVTGDLRAWAAALALSPRAVDLGLAQQLREKLGLRAESWQLEALIQSGQALENGLRFDPDRRREWLDWLVRAELQPDGIASGGTLARALDFWSRELDEEEKERASREKEGLLAWKNSPAARQLARERALLALWREPDAATDVLYELWQSEDQSAAVAEALAGYAPRDSKFAERIADPVSDPVILLPWSMVEHCSKRTARRLTRMGIGAGLRAAPRGRFPVRGRSWLAVGVACGLGGMGAIRFGGVVGALGGGIGVGLAIGLWAWCEREKLLYRGRQAEAPVQEHPTFTQEPEPPFRDPLPMVEIPGGTFLMGSPEDDDQAYDDEHPQHPVTISPFLMSETTVTQALYREVMDTQPEEWQEDQDDGQLPANHLSWFDAVAFCNRLSEHADLEPCYEIEGKKVTWRREANGYRLPTEAEWEYACRAGTTTRWFWGNREAGAKKHAWFSGNSGSRVHLAGKKRANPWGLHDMAGNVWEWCWDWHGDYSSDSQINPTGPSDGISRALRGGAFLGEPWNLRSADRLGREPEFRGGVIGFRVACSRRQS